MTRPDTPTLQARLVAVMSADHMGRANGIHAKDLAAKLGVPERRLRRLITEARFDALAICGKPATGYFVALTPDELQESAAFWRRRAEHSLAMASRVLGIAMPELLGQLQLNQG